ncbi:MAG: DNA sulfur modification protein DndB [Alicyclobacillus macrosporangiidus]|uniref:DNA sulfur modification protein DndB n=1 Tax=Alicyclobacillus macrosporangiidus TaxID=392015 RepID=UPI0026F201E6|nr:DNA sulfur modification protein DndB [Alicyclobacillus macrosporangiidus]MCL6597498.1 DNA sulfur modification protein DndB [Alicyclobacillus macrosporangiidus]
MYYTFPAIRGVQAGREYYVSMCPLRLVPRLFLFDETELEPELRSQRVINKSRIPLIAQYMVNHPNDYVFSALTVSIDGTPQFIPLSTEPEHYNIGTVKIPMSARFIINDGQHRRAGIEVALRERPELGNETIAVVFFVDEGLKRCQQMFADLNRYSIRPTESLTILYDYRDPLAEIARTLTQTVPIFNGLTEFEKSTISNRSSKLFTLSGIYRATAELLDGLTCSFEEKLAIATAFWTSVSSCIPEWNAVKSGHLSAGTLRRDYIHAHAIFLVALGKVGRTLLNLPAPWGEKLQPLADVDWHRSNPRWEGRVTVGGRISFSRSNLQELTNELMQILHGDCDFRTVE